MTADPSISDAYTVTTAALCEASGLCPDSLWLHRQHGNLGQPQKRRGVRGNFWTPSQANKFLKRIGKTERF